MEYKSNLKYLPDFGTTHKRPSELIFHGQGRIGARVTSHSARRALGGSPKDYQDKIAATYLRECLDESNAQLDTTTSNYRRLALQNQREILTELMNLGGRKMSPHELVAVLAFKHGFGQKLTDLANAASALQKRGKDIVSGDMPSVARICSSGILSKVHEHLYAKKEVVTPQEIAECVRFDSPKKVDLINTSLGVLELMGLAVKLPGKKTGSRGFTYPYLHKEHALSSQHAHLTIPHWNSDYNLLLKLRNSGGAIPYIELFPMSERSVKSKSISLRGKGETSTEVDAVKRLTYIGLITIERLDAARGQVVRLHEHTAALLARSSRALDDELRKLLLREAKAANELQLPHQKPYVKLLARLRLIQDIRHGLSVDILANKHGISRATINDILRGRRALIHGKLGPNLIRVYLPKLEAEEPELADLLKHILDGKKIF